MIINIVHMTTRCENKRKMYRKSSWYSHNSLANLRRVDNEHSLADCQFF